MLGNVINNAGDVAALVVLFGVTIFVHELGHFLAAKSMGMVVDTFSIGFGPALWKRKIRGVVYKVAWIPFGGYVALPQLDPAAMSSVQGGSAEQRRLPEVSPWRKVLVSVSGALGNVALAALLALVIYAFGADADSDRSETVVGYVAPGSAAHAEGLRAGDRILEVNGKAVETWYDYKVECVLGAGQEETVELRVRTPSGDRSFSLSVADEGGGVYAVPGVEKAMLCLVSSVRPGSAAEAAGILPGDIVREADGVPVVSSQHFVDLIAQRGAQPVRLEIERDGKRVMLEATPRFDPEHGRPMLGVAVEPALLAQRMPWMQHRHPLRQLRQDAMAIVRILRALVTPREARQAAGALGGPLMIFMALWASIQVSVLNAVGFLRFLNVNLAILNLLPIPVLDGGHIVFSVWEGVTRRRADPRLVNALVNVFAALLILGMLVITFRDLQRVFPRLPRLGRPAAERAAAVGGGENGR